MENKGKKAYRNIPKNKKGVVPNKELLDLLPRDLVLEFKAFVFEKKRKTIKIAAVDPDNKMLRQYVKERLGDEAEWFYTTDEDITFVLKNYLRDFRKEIESIIADKSDINGNVAILVDSIIEFAFAEKASDLHIEPLRDETVIRFRIDGVLQNMAKIPRPMHQSVVARFKVLADLKIDENRRPQDGRIELEKYPDTILRISTIPTLFGEKVAARILNDTNKTLAIADLGFSKEQEQILLRNIEKPFGMIVASGPTGAGKTTTLYMILGFLKKEDINISTLEDPVEYSLDGINQIQINPRLDLTFASGLRSLLRQDPDAIMVGEIRDSETAVMAANAAMTGHLVFTTIHTNDAPSAFVRLLEMNVEDFVVASTVNLVIAQRLVRRVCTACAEEQSLSEAVIRKIKERGDIMASIKKLYPNSEGILEKRKFKVGKGCDICIGTGYVGRVGLFELLELNKEIHDLILTHAPAERIREAADKQGFRDMIIDGIQKVFDGATSFEEVIRTTRIT
ncbi:GspE/PulE family protein [Patescibacteria group bacterium]